jgi:hypothetical protein
MIKRDDPAMATVKRFDKAVKDLKQIELKAPIMRDNGDKFAFRQRIFKKH